MHRPSSQRRPDRRCGPVFFHKCLGRLHLFWKRRRRYCDSFYQAGPGRLLHVLYYRFHSRCARGRCFLVMFNFRFCLQRQIGHIVTVVPPELDGDIFVNRAGVGFLLSDAQFREKLQNFMSLYFQLPSQLVNANLSHKNSSLRHKRIAKSN
jgi:hypothetical protein